MKKSIIPLFSFSMFFFMSTVLMVFLSAVPMFRIRVLESMAWMTGILTFLLDF